MNLVCVKFSSGVMSMLIMIVIVIIINNVNYYFYASAPAPIGVLEALCFWGRVSVLACVHRACWCPGVRPGKFVSAMS